MPSMKEVNEASRYQICAWWRYLPSPETEAEAEVLERIVQRFKILGGFTPEISKALSRR